MQVLHRYYGLEGTVCGCRHNGINSLMAVVILEIPESNARGLLEYVSRQVLRSRVLGGHRGVFSEMCETPSQATSTLAWLNQKPEGKCSGLIGSESIHLFKSYISQDMGEGSAKEVRVRKYDHQLGAFSRVLEAI